jgi:hypothetical protein
MKKFKVVVKKAPQQMKYGGQSSSYGLSLNHRGIYSNMADNPHEDVGKTLKPVPRNQANIEAERGETAYGDFNGDGQNEHMFIPGKLHSEGGTPLNVPEGTFIYSNTKKMRLGGAILSNFGKGKNDKKRYTPAELAKQYDINKYKAILNDPNSDALAKKTAKNMIANYERKLAELALVQEGMKGFPQGIPKVAEPLMKKQSSQGGNEQQPMAAYGGMYGAGGFIPNYDSIDPYMEYGGMYQDGGSPLYSTQGQTLRNYNNTLASLQGGWSGSNVTFPHLPTNGPIEHNYISRTPDHLPGLGRGLTIPRYFEDGGEEDMYARGGQKKSKSSNKDQQIIQGVAQMLQQGAKPEEILQELIMVFLNN